MTGGRGSGFGVVLPIPIAIALAATFSFSSRLRGSILFVFDSFLAGVLTVGVAPAGGRGRLRIIGPTKLKGKIIDLAVSGSRLPRLSRLGF